MILKQQLYSLIGLTLLSLVPIDATITIAIDYNKKNNEKETLQKTIYKDENIGEWKKNNLDNTRLFFGSVELRNECSFKDYRVFDHALLFAVDKSANYQHSYNDDKPVEVTLDNIIYKTPEKGDQISYYGNNFINIHIEYLYSDEDWCGPCTYSLMVDRDETIGHFRKNEKKQLIENFIFFWADNKLTDAKTFRHYNIPNNALLFAVSKKDPSYRYTYDYSNPPKSHYFKEEEYHLPPYRGYNNEYMNDSPLKIGVKGCFPDCFIFSQCWRNSDQKIKTVKDELEEYTLYWGDQELDDEKTLSDYSIHNYGLLFAIDSNYKDYQHTYDYNNPTVYYDGPCTYQGPSKKIEYNAKSKKNTLNQEPEKNNQSKKKIFDPNSKLSHNSNNSSNTLLVKGFFLIGIVVLGGVAYQFKKKKKLSSRKQRESGTSNLSEEYSVYSNRTKTVFNIHSNQLRLSLSFVS